MKRWAIVLAVAVAAAVLTAVIVLTMKSSPPTAPEVGSPADPATGRRVPGPSLMLKGGPQGIRRLPERAPGE